jgi:hypothetical protein
MGYSTVATTEEDLTSLLTTNSRDVYVAFVDLLGFSDRVKKNWTDAATVYGAIMAEAERRYANHASFWGQGKERAPLATMRTLSDSIAIVGTDLIEVGYLAQAIQTAALVSGNMLVRGGIAFGAHSAVEISPHSYMVSRPLAAAAGLEGKVANYPRIVLDRDSGVENSACELRRRGHSLFMECEDGLWMVQPFSFDLEQANRDGDRFAPARDILEPLAAAYKGTVHSPKYDWMLSRVDIVTSYMEELAGHPDNPANFDDEE